MRDEFDDAFERLREVSNELADIERTSENFDEIVAKRVELDNLRSEATDERSNIVSRFEPPAPDVVEPVRGRQHTRLFGKLGALVAVALLVAIAAVGYIAVRNVGRVIDLDVVSVSERIDENCAWQVRAELVNNSERTVTVVKVKTIIDRKYRPAQVISSPKIAAGEVGVILLTWSKGWVGGCQNSTEDIDHSKLIMTLKNGTEISRGF